MNTWELIKALEEGKTIFEISHNDPQCKTIIKLNSYECNSEHCTQKVHRYLGCYGWGSYGQTEESILVYLFQNPNDWKIEE